MTGTVAQGLVGLAQIDALFSLVKWNGPVDYSVPTPAEWQAAFPTRSDYGPWYPTGPDPDGAGPLLPPGYNELSGPLQLNNAQLAAAERAFAEVMQFTNLVAARELVSPVGVADIRMGMTTMPNPSRLKTDGTWTAYAWSPGTGNGGDIWFNTTSYNAPVLGTYAYQTFFHEIGHALGLKHPHEADTQSGGNTTTLPSQWDSLEFTTMTYRSAVGSGIDSYKNPEGSYPQTYMALDIYALQTMYGADFTSTSNNVYAFTPNSGRMTIDGVSQALPISNVIFRTIWDGGGTDTYDFSAYTNTTRRLSIDLRPASFLDPNAGWTDLDVGDLRQRALLDGRVAGDLTDDVYARGHISNPFLFNNDTRSLIENAIAGAGDDTIFGNQAGNRLEGRDGADSLFGQDGNDTLLGGNGSADFGDTLNGGVGFDRASYADSNGPVTIDLRGTEGKGLFNAAFGDVLVSIEDILGSNFGDRLLGNDTVSERLDGNDGDDSIDAGGGNDTQIGGAGNDTLLTGAGNDSLNGGTGFNTIEFHKPMIASWQTGQLDADIAGDTWVNWQAISGSSGNDTIRTNSFGFNITLFGNAGDDILATANGADTLIGGDGLDTISGGTGNDSLDGSAGDDSLSGSDGEDTLRGGDGWDTLDGGNGADMASYSELANGVRVELNFDRGDGTFGKITGATVGDVFLSIEDIEGTPGNDTLLGRPGISNKFLGGNGNDSLDGLGGADFLYGGIGDDTLVARGGDQVMDGGFGGFDTIAVGGISGVFDFAANSFSVDGVGIIQVFNMEGAIGGAGGDRFTANFDNLTFRGGEGNDTLIGGSGDNVIEGGAGTDLLTFGGGFDYVDFRDSTTGLLVDIRSSFLGLGLRGGDNWVDLPEGILGGSGNDSLGGTDSFNRILGRGGNDYVSGYGNLDTIDGGDGDDSLEGGLGEDLLFGGAGNDKLGDNEQILLLSGLQDGASDSLFGDAGDDSLYASLGDDSLDGGTGADLLIGGAGSDTAVGGEGSDALDLGEDEGGADLDIAVFGAVRAAFQITLDLDGATFLVADLRDGAPLGTDSVFGAEFFRFLDGDIDWSLILAPVPTLGSESLVGTIGADTIDALAGNDTIDGLDDADSLTGGEGNDSLIGGAGNDTLVAGAGTDVLIGGLGDDTYVIDSLDTVTEGRNAGTDTVVADFSLTLGLNLENLVLTGAADLTGTGNTLRNAITGNAGANALTGLGGNDTLDGGAGADTMDGGAANDTYIVDDVGDQVIELAAGGRDVIRASVSWILGDQVENLVLTGTADLTGTGNAVANAITGNGGANLLDGAGGNDTLSGNGDTDTLIGGIGNDSLVGGNGADSLVGGTGRDSMAGGAGADTFRWLAIAEGGDVITGFVSGEDVLSLAPAGFGGGLVAGMDLGATGRLVAGAAPTAALGQFLYDQATGALSWDVDGTGVRAARLLATFDAGTVVVASDLQLVA